MGRLLLPPNLSSMLDMAILGLLREGPMHGYEVRQRLLGIGLWRISFGSVYPALRRLHRAGYLTARSGPGRRKEYRITDAGNSHFRRIMEDEASEVDNSTAFGVRLAFFGHLRPAKRIAFLERRKAVLEQRIAAARRSLASPPAGSDDRYMRSLVEHSMLSAQTDLAWLDELIALERSPEQPD